MDVDPMQDTATPDSAGAADVAADEPRPGDLPVPGHTTPPGVDDATIEALGKLSEALETAERARGHLYSFHQLTGSADIALGEAVKALRSAGHQQIADRIDTELVGRNVLPGRWTFQIVEAYDDDYWSLFRQLEQEARDQLAVGRRHLYEARMKQRERTVGLPGHEAGPAEPPSGTDSA
ncbi:hypothetical protein GCM10009841_07470 [Microlunatus panaciterrae]|uniref:Uncharacterized protein n=1 Tax=Microlunatus panaciterrae TaxID=400768 RepID=A0ABS2RHX2_9ACTN|nr:hypothetical protein [Microlunatus panaciterrae]MBM7798599.1 hypothetical protein [Microlunatus panaciterrae]